MRSRNSRTPRAAACFLHPLSAVIELAQVGAGTESGFQGAVQNQRVGVALHALQRRRKLLQLLERERTDLIAGIAMQRQFDDAVFKLPGERLAFEWIHLHQYQSTRCTAFRGQDALATAGGTPALLS